MKQAGTKWTIGQLAEVAMLVVASAIGVLQRCWARSVWSGEPVAWLARLLS